MSDRDIKPANIPDAERWHSRHQRAEDLPSYSLERWQERVGGDALAFVARGSGRIHGPDGDGEGVGEWRIWAWPGAPINGPEALLAVSFGWEDDIAESAKHDSLGGIALDLASCERLAEAAAHAASVLRAGQWVPRPVLASQGPVMAAEMREAAQANALAQKWEGAWHSASAVIAEQQVKLNQARADAEQWEAAWNQASALIREQAVGVRKLKNHIDQLEAELDREREQTRIARAQCARAQAERDTTWAALRQAVATHAAEKAEAERIVRETRSDAAIMATHVLEARDARKEHAAAKARVAELEQQLENEHTWWPLPEEVSRVFRGWGVFPGEETPGRDVAFFSGEQDAQLYAQWRRAHELAKADDDQDPGWEHVNVLPAEFKGVFWNSCDAAPALRSDGEGPT